uniref:Uncharacterized protein n=1 Tax=Knipowitschia caucasica TaxID=637954 RepID=A0AAV2K2B4_KNICA
MRNTTGVMDFGPAPDIFIWLTHLTKTGAVSPIAAAAPRSQSTVIYPGWQRHAGTAACGGVCEGGQMGEGEVGEGGERPGSDKEGARR